MEGLKSEEAVGTPTIVSAPDKEMFLTAVGPGWVMFATRENDYTVRVGRVGAVVMVGWPVRLREIMRWDGKKEAHRWNGVEWEAVDDYTAGREELVLRLAREFRAKRAEEERRRVVPDPPPYDELYYRSLEEAEREDL